MRKDKETPLFGYRPLVRDGEYDYPPRCNRTGCTRDANGYYGEYGVAHTAYCSVEHYLREMLELPEGTAQALWQLADAVMRLANMDWDPEDDRARQAWNVAYHVQQAMTPKEDT